MIPGALLRLAEVDLGALAENLDLLRGRLGADAAVDLRGDAWGHGAAGVRDTVARAGFRHVLDESTAGEVPGAIGAEAFGLADEVDGTVGAGLRPVLALTSVVIDVKAAAVGAGISYGYTYRTARATRIALVGAGYGDGLPRSASNRGPLQLAGRRFTIAGRMAMDAMAVDVGDAEVAAGDRAVVFGRGDDGAPTAAEWGRVVGRSAAEVVGRLQRRVPRRYLP